MTTQLLLILICVGLVTGQSTRVQRSHSPNKAPHQRNRSVSQQQSTKVTVIKILQENNLSTSNKHFLSSQYQSTNGYHKISTGQHKIPGQSTSDQHQHISNHIQHASEDTFTTKKQQSHTKSEVQLSSRHYPHRTDATNSGSYSDSLYIPDQVFLCNDGKFKILRSSVCNGQTDCPDRSDELPTLCLTSSQPPESNKCSVKEFRCPNGKCIPKNNIKFSDRECWVAIDPPKTNDNTHCPDSMFLCDNKTKCVSKEKRCNGVQDCQDNTDEIMSPWTKTIAGPITRCPNQYCISKQAECNGFNDCGDHSDEVHCNNIAHQTRQPGNLPCSGYICSSGTCINSDQVCNGFNDCEDNSDESTCDNNTWLWSDLSSSNVLIITLSVLGGTVLIIFAAVLVVIICYRRKYKALKTQSNRMDNRPLPYWQIIGAETLNPAKLCEHKSQGQDNAHLVRTAVLPA